MVAPAHPSRTTDPPPIAEGIAPSLMPETVEADRDADAGVGIPADEILSWVRSWGSSNELPMPKARTLDD